MLRRTQTILHHLNANKSKLFITGAPLMVSASQTNNYATIAGDQAKLVMRARAFAIAKNAKKLPTTPVVAALTSEQLNAGEDGFFIAANDATASNATVIGVADGVGGWTEHGVDPSEISRTLMVNAQQVALQNANATPKTILQQAYEKIIADGKVKAGSCTACLVKLNSTEHTLSAANLGDSGFGLLRKDEHGEFQVVFRTQEQQHYFNAPFQMAIPIKEQSNFFNDNPEKAQDIANVAVKEGDVIVLGTDGLFDNVFDADVCTIVTRTSKHHSEDAFAQACAEELCKTARYVGASGTIASPFERNAKAHGYVFKGGKLDDVTVIVSKIVKE